jgi:hypothetical protein
MTMRENEWDARSKYSVAYSGVSNTKFGRRPETGRGCDTLDYATSAGKPGAAGTQILMMTTRPSLIEQKPPYRPTSVSTSMECAPHRPNSRQLEILKTQNELDNAARNYTPVSRAVMACASRRIHGGKDITAMLSGKALTSNMARRPSSNKTYESIVAKVGEPPLRRRAVTPTQSLQPHRAMSSSIANCDLQRALDMGNIIEVPSDNTILCLVLLEPNETWF